MSKVLFVIFQSPNKANGGVASISQIIENLNQTKPIVITQIDNQKTTEWKSKGIEVKVWSQPKSTIIALIIYNLRSFFYCLFNGKLRSVHCNDINAMSFFGIGAWLAGKKLIFNIRDVKSKGNYGFKWKLATRLAKKIIVLSNDMKELIVGRIGINSDKVISIYSIVDFDLFTPKTSKESEILKVGCVAAVFTKKQQLKFLKEAGSMVKELPKNITLSFIGDYNPETDEYSKACQTELISQGLEGRIKFTGYQNDMPEVYRGLDINLVISEREGLARGMIESISVGTPVISFDVPSAKEILLDNNCGKVIPQGDYHTLIDIIKYYHKNREELKVLSKNAITVSRKLFRQSDIISSYEKVYLS